MRKIILLICTLNFSPSLFSQSEVNSQIDSNTVNYDLLTIEVCENGIKSNLTYIIQNDDVWGLTNDKSMKILNQDQKSNLLIVWISMLDYFAQLDYIEQNYHEFYTDDGEEIITDYFLCYYLAFLTQYRYALQFLDIIERNAALHTILNEAYPDIGLAKNSYRQFKFHFLNVVIATKFVALNAIHKKSAIQNSNLYDQKIINDVKFIYSMGKGRGIELTFDNALKIVHDAVFTLWFPVQKSVAKWMGETKIRRKGHSLISLEDIIDISQQLYPGDIIFERREWVLTNVGLPGYWTHSALFIGTPEERRNLLTDDEVTIWVKSEGEESGDFEKLLEKTYPEAYALSTTNQENNYYPRTIEAVAEGVVFMSLEKSISCDAVVVLRPKLSNKEKARAIFRAFYYFGSPYDYNFDFLTDLSLVCTELIFKSYEPSDKYSGITFNTIELGDRIVTPVNEMARQFDQQYGTAEQQLDFVLFYDGYEKIDKAIPAHLSEFRKSWKRPDWHIFIQNKK